MPTTIELCFEVEDEAMQEHLLADLAGYGFSGFLQDDHALKAYLDASRWRPELREQLNASLKARGLVSPAVREIADENWNAQWEASIQPLAVGPFLVKPSWAEAPPAHKTKTMLEIDPKMSFGTGQHASTRLALRLLSDLVEPGDRVLDAGAGTGILAIAAVKQGAVSALAFDVDPRARENATENIRRNGVVDQVTFRVGVLADVPEMGFDVILANIHRAVLIEMLPAFVDKLAAEGRVALAGLFQSDRAAILEAAASCDLDVLRERAEDDWWGVGLRNGNR